MHCKEMQIPRIQLKLDKNMIYFKYLRTNEIKITSGRTCSLCLYNSNNRSTSRINMTTVSTEVPFKYNGDHVHI